MAQKPQWQLAAEQLINRDQLQEAYDLLRQIRQPSHEFATAYALQGQILESTRQIEFAMQHFLQASRLAPENTQYHFATARCMAQLATTQEDILEVLRTYAKLFLTFPAFIADEKPHQQQLLDKLGLWVFGRFDEKTAARRLVNFPVEEKPRVECFYDYFNNNLRPQGIDNILYSLRQYNDMIYRYFDDPDIGKSYGNAAVLFKNLGLFDISAQVYNHSIELLQERGLSDDETPLIYTQKGMDDLMRGDMLTGGRLMEARWKQDLPGYNDLPFNYPRWQGEPLEGKHILIAAEQGLGDGLQFVRYTLEMKKRGLDITVFNKPGVDRLLSYNLAKHGIPTIIPDRDGWGEFDCFIPMMSLPYYLGVTIDTIPYRNGYLETPPEYLSKWQEKIKPSGKFKVGVVWSGSKGHDRNKERSISVELILPLFELDAEFHCLQKVVDEGDRIVLQNVENLIFHDQELDDFCDTAGLVEQLDLVVTVDTSVAHLAGALNFPTWIMITYIPDFRWLLYRNDSVQYNSVTLFRQRSDCHWEPVIDNVKQALAQKIRTFHG